MSENSSRVLLDQEKLQDLQDRIYRSSNVMVTVLDEKGNWITDSLPVPDDCRRPEDLNEGSRSAAGVYKEVFLRAKESGGPEIVICSALKHAAAGFPVYYQSELVYVWILSHFTFNGQEMEGGGDLPVLTEASLWLLFDFISVLTEDAFQLQMYYAKIMDLEERSNKLVYKDRLLGLPNELRLEEDLKINGGCPHLILLDIVDLRKINDAYGRKCGDKLLEAMRDYIQTLELAELQCLYRLETADFGILLHRMKETDLNDLVRKIYQRFNMPWVLVYDDRQVSIFINVAIGILPVLEETDTILQNLESAIEHTLDVAKKNDGIAFFDGGANDDSRSRLKLELSLRRSVRQNMKGFYVVYQPIVDPGVAVWRGVEALCRWESDEYGLVPPVQFIPLAESSGMIGTIGQWVLETAIAQMKEWKLDQIENFILDVNLSPIQLNNPVIDYIIISILEKYNYPAERLCLEITESNELNLTTHIRNIIEDLHNAGIVIALDDFGTGYASLSSLHKLPVKILKTDRSFIKGMENDLFLQHLFNMMVDIAHFSDMKIVAEGVETDLQAQILRKQGADYFQGYKFSKPLTAQQLEENLVNFHKPSKELVSMGYTRLDLTNLSDEKGGYDLHPSLYKMLNRCMQVLFSHPDGSVGIDFALSYVGDGLKVSRSYIFLKEEDGTFSNAYEWCAAGIHANKNHLQHMNIDEVSSEWIKVLKRDGMIITSDVDIYEYAEIGILKANGVKAVVEFPIWQEDGLFGFIGFHDCEKPHYWSREEIQMIHTLSSLITATLGKMKLQQQIALKEQSLESILNHLGNPIYVTHPDTYEILFANQAMSEGCGGEVKEGALCYQAIHGYDAPCDFCPVPYLLEHEEEIAKRIFFNKRLNAYFNMRDAMIPWAGKAKVHFGHGTDITDLKYSEIKSKVERELDSLTGHLNKESFIRLASFILVASRARERRAVMVAVQFKTQSGYVVSQYEKNKDLILFAREILETKVKAPDVFCRYSERGAAILLYDCDMDTAVTRLEEVTRLLTEKSIEKEIPLDFRYGLAEKDEINSEDAICEAEGLLELAEKRLNEKINRNDIAESL